MLGKELIHCLIKESEKNNVILILSSREEAIEAAAEFVKTASEIRIKEDLSTTMDHYKHYFKFLGMEEVNNQLLGCRAKVIVYIPILEEISIKKGGVCTVKQFWKKQQERK